MIKKISAFVFFIFSSAFTYSQSPDWLWAKSFGGPDGIGGYESAIDGAGNIYITGGYLGPTDFDPGPGVYSLQSASSWSPDVFISKLTADGNFVWAKRIGYIGGDSGNSITVDQSGFLYVTGIFTSTVDFDPGPATFNLTGNNGDIFVTKFDTAGNFIWAKSMGGTASDRGLAISLDDLSHIYITATFLDTVDFDPGSGTFELIGTGQHANAIIKLDTAGNFIWAKALMGNIAVVGYSMAYDSTADGAVYTSGWFVGTVDFDPGPVLFTKSAVGWQGYDAYISKLDTAGNFLWVVQLGDSGWDIATTVYLDASGSVYTTGQFEGTVDFDPGSGVQNLVSTGRTSTFISKLSIDGDFIMAKAIGGDSTSVGLHVAVEPTPEADIYLTGWFRGTIDFDPGPGNLSATSSGNSDTYISKYDSAGNILWLHVLGGPYQETGFYIALSSAGNAHLLGTYGSSMLNIGSHLLLNSASSGTDANVFIAKLDLTTSIGQQQYSHEIRIFPNPATETVFIERSKAVQPARLEMLVSFGRIMIATMLASADFRVAIDVKSFAPGIYFVRLWGEKSTTLQKVMVQR